MLAFALAPAVQAQDNAAPVSREVVQPLPSPEVQRLNAALRRLASNDSDVAALVDAGNAALKLGDREAAQGFFSRAGELAPGNADARLGLAAVMLQSERPVEALQLFDEAEKAGAPAVEIAGERGLAYDLVGNNAEAQRNYRAAIEAQASDEITRRLALSQAISGDRKGFEATLLPLLQRRDLAAYRTRAFGLAIMGEVEEAGAIAAAAMPKDLAGRMLPYFAYMPRLTRAQQAAAANLGIFPQAAQIGRGDPRLAQYAASGGAAANRADARLAPQGEPLGGGASAEPARRGASDDRRRRNDRAERGTGKQPAPAAKPEQAGPAGSASQLASVSRGQQAVVPPPPAAAMATPASRPEQRPSVADAFAGFDRQAQPSAAASSGAVDITAIKAPREAPPEPVAKPAAKPAPPKYPSRIWVQLATGREPAALKFDWRRFARKAPDELGRMTPHIVKWGQANRLLAGPVASDREARELLKALKSKGLDGFAYTSPEGEKIDKLQ